MKLPSFFKRFSSIRHSLFCCRGFQAFWENREKSGMSIEVHQRDGKPEFWLQMRVVDQAQVADASRGSSARGSFSPH